LTSAWRNAVTLSVIRYPSHPSRYRRPVWNRDAGGCLGLNAAGRPFKGTSVPFPTLVRQRPLQALSRKVSHMNGIIYLVGLVVVVIAVLSFFGLR
jgi:hypothetical protein